MGTRHTDLEKYIYKICLVNEKHGRKIPDNTAGATEIQRVPDLWKNKDQKRRSNDDAQTTKKVMEPMMKSKKFLRRSEFVHTFRLDPISIIAKPTCGEASDTRELAQHVHTDLHDKNEAAT